MAEFYDELFDICESQGTKVGSRFKTVVLENLAGEEERIIRWNSPLLSFDLSKTLFSREMKNYVIDFFDIVGGANVGFRYKDWSDYYATETANNNKYGSLTQGILYGAGKEYQLIKTYKVGNCISYRPITRPIAETISIYENGVLSTEWNEENGKINFINQPTGTLTANFHFDVPVIFSEQIRYDLKRDNGEQQNYSLQSLKLEEIREEHQYCPFDSFGELEIFKLKGYIDSVTELENENEIIELTSGYKTRTVRWEDNKRSYFLNSQVLDQEQLDYLIAFWRCAKGKGLEFNFDDRTFEHGNIRTRFKLDNLILQLNKQGLYQTEGIRLVVINSFNYEVLLGSIPSSFEAGSFVAISGQLIDANSRLPIRNSQLTIQFDFAENEERFLITDTEGFFETSFNIKPNLLHPDSGKLIVKNTLANFIYKEIDVVTNGQAEPVFSLSIPGKITSGGTIIASGNAPPATTVHVVSQTKPGYNPLFNISLINTSTTSNAVGRWSVEIPTLEEQLSSRIQVTASHEDFKSITEETIIEFLDFDPILGLNQVIYN